MKNSSQVNITYIWICALVVRICTCCLIVTLYTLGYKLVWVMFSKFWGGRNVSMAFLIAFTSGSSIQILSWNSGLFSCMPSELWKIIHCIAILLRCCGIAMMWFTELGFSSPDNVKIIATKIKLTPMVFLEGRTILLRTSLVVSLCNSCCCLQKNENSCFQNSILGVLFYFLENWPEVRVLWCKRHSALMCGLAGVILVSEYKEALSFRH